MGLDLRYNVRCWWISLHRGSRTLTINHTLLFHQIRSGSYDFQVYWAYTRQSGVGRSQINGETLVETSALHECPFGDGTGGNIKLQRNNTATESNDFWRNNDFVESSVLNDLRYQRVGLPWQQFVELWFIIHMHSTLLKGLFGWSTVPISFFWMQSPSGLVDSILHDPLFTVHPQNFTGQTRRIQGLLSQSKLHT